MQKIKSILKYGVMSIVFIWCSLYIGANIKYKVDKVEDNIVDSRELVHDRRGEGIEFGKFHQMGHIHSAEYIDANFDLYDAQLAKIYTKDQINSLAADLITNVLVFTEFDFSNKTNSNGEVYTPQMYYDEIMAWLQERYDYQYESFTNTATDIVIDWPDPEDPGVIPIPGDYPTNYSHTCKWDNDTGWITFYEAFNKHNVVDGSGNTISIGYRNVTNPTKMGNNSYNRLLLRRIGDLVELQVRMISYIPKYGNNVIFSVPYGFRPMDAVYGMGTSHYNYSVEYGSRAIPMGIEKSASQTYTPLWACFDSGVNKAEVTKDGNNKHWPIHSAGGDANNELVGANSDDVKEKTWELLAHFTYLTKDEWVKRTDINTAPSQRHEFVPEMITLRFKSGNNNNTSKRPGEANVINVTESVPKGVLYTMPTPESKGFSKLYGKASLIGWTTVSDPENNNNHIVQYEPGKSYVIKSALTLYPVYATTDINFAKPFVLKIGNEKDCEIPQLKTKKGVHKIKSFATDSYSVEISKAIKKVLNNTNYDRETIILKVETNGTAGKPEFSMHVKLVHKNQRLYNVQIYYKGESVNSPKHVRSTIDYIIDTTISFGGRLDYPKDNSAFKNIKQATASGEIKIVGVKVY